MSWSKHISSGAVLAEISRFWFEFVFILAMGKKAAVPKAPALRIHGKSKASHPKDAAKAEGKRKEQPRKSDLGKKNSGVKDVKKRGKEDKEDVKTNRDKKAHNDRNLKQLEKTLPKKKKTQKPEVKCDEKEEIQNRSTRRSALRKPTSTTPSQEAGHQTPVKGNRGLERLGSKSSQTSSPAPLEDLSEIEADMKKAAARGISLKDFMSEQSAEQLDEHMRKLQKENKEKQEETDNDDEEDDDDNDDSESDEEEESEDEETERDACVEPEKTQVVCKDDESSSQESESGSSDSEESEEEEEEQKKTSKKKEDNKNKEKELAKVADDAKKVDEQAKKTQANSISN